MVFLSNGLTAFLTLEAAMLFYLDKSLIEDDVLGTPQLYNFLEDLCNARRNGRHLIFAETKILEVLLTLPELSPRAHRTLSTVKRRIRGKLSIFKSCTVYVRIIKGHNTLLRREQNGKAEILISVDMIQSDELFSKTRILVENRTDGNFYTSIAKILIAQEKATQGLSLNYELVSGGGSQTPREYQALKNSNYLVYCIIDADIDFPGAALGSNTAEPIYNMDLADPHPLKESIILNCYSAENLLHPSMIKNALQLNGNEPWYSEIERLFESEIWRYLALKTRKTCSDFTGESDKSLYWASQRNLFSTQQCAPLCIKDRCSIYTPLRSQTLERVSNYLNSSFSESSFVMPITQSFAATEWHKIKDGILSWACSGGHIS